MIFQETLTFMNQRIMWIGSPSRQWFQQLHEPQFHNWAVFKTLISSHFHSMDIHGLLVG
jgi:hypothetical protein